MSRLEAIVGRLPSLYRPELAPGAVPATLFEAVLAAVASALDATHRDVGEVLRTRWLNHADRAEYERFFDLSRRLDPTLSPTDFPYLRDLARLAALLPLVPWEQPVALRENVEDFRLRVRRMVRLYREGLSTTGALRAVVEATLPVDLEAPEPQRDLPFLVEPFVGFRQGLKVATRGAPDGQLGPLMRFSLRNRGLLPAVPTFHVQGLAPEHGGPAEVASPMLELYRDDVAGRFPRVGLALRGTLATGDTLRLRPAFSAWEAALAGVRRARSAPGPETPANPAVDAPWETPPAAPAGPVRALAQTEDRVLWAAADDGGGSSLWRFDGQAWDEAVSGLPRVNGLLEDGQDLLVATASGLRRMALYPVSPAPFDAVDVAAVGGAPVHVVHRGADGGVWLGTDTALLRLEAGDTVAPFVLGSRPELEAAVYALAEDSTGTLYVGSDRGVFQHQRSAGTWAWYEGTSATEQQRDWQPFDPADPAATLPAAEDAFVPAVHSLHRGPDGTLWLGTAGGIARYLARPPLTPSGAEVGAGLSLVTVLEAFPDLDAGRVHAIREDARGRVWFAAEHGLFRFDGRDLWQRQADAWVQLGRADRLYPAGRPSLGRGTWRFDESAGHWQRFDQQAGRWNDFVDPPRSTLEPEVWDLLWITETVAETGSFDGETFSDPVPVADGDLAVRVKPDETRIVDGGIPGLPALPAGTSVWRYLAMEPAGYTPPAGEPSWSPEGRRSGAQPAGLGEAPGPARFDVAEPFPPSDFDGSVFTYAPVAQVWASWEERHGRSVLVRLDTSTRGEQPDPAILDRVWQGIQLVRPAGVRTALAVDETIVKVRDGST